MKGDNNPTARFACTVTNEDELKLEDYGRELELTMSSEMRETQVVLGPGQVRALMEWLALNFKEEE